VESIIYCALILDWSFGRQSIAVPENEKTQLSLKAVDSETDLDRVFVEFCACGFASKKSML
jgi:hypothetical protein